MQASNEQQPKQQVLVDSKYKKMYRSVIDTSKKLDEIYKSQSSFSRIFTTETTLLREKLQKYCETLIFREPVEYGKKAEEIMWRRCFYEIINIVKANKNNLKSNTEIETMYRLHLASSYGFYSHLILKFQTEFGQYVKIDGFLDFPIINYEKQPVNNINIENTEFLKEILIRILHKFLICLGDLARYQIEYDLSSNTRLAYKYYKKSLILLPTNGTPLNQIGTLVGSENYGCDAAYYYLYCLNCTEPFSGAKENLKFLFAKNQTRYEKLIANIKKMPDRSKMDDDQLALLRLKEIKRFIVLYLHLIDCILFQNQSISNHQLQELCQLCLQEFNSCMFYTKSNIPNNNKDNNNDETTQKVYYLSDELVFKLTLIILMSIEQLKIKKLHQTNSSNIYFICVAFAILFFSHILNRTIIRLQDSLSNMSNKNNRLLSVEDMNEEDLDAKETESVIAARNESKSRSSSSSSTSCSSTSSRSSGSDKSGRTKSNKVKLLYGLRRRKHNSDSDSNEDEEDENDYSKSDNDDDTVVQSSGSDRRSRRRNEIKRKAPIKKNVAKFLDRDNLSETELNLNSENSSSDENTSSANSSVKKTSSKNSNQNINKQTNNNNLTSSNQLSKEENNNKSLETNIQLQNNNQNDMEFFQLDLVNNSTNTVDFKEFSTQLFSSFSLIGQQQNQSATQQSFNNIINTATSEDFVDNEIYKFVLSGNKDVGIPPGFEMNPKEAQEIEELGQKIASFQIETDTEMSIFNTDDTVSSSDSDSSSSYDSDEKNTKGKKNLNNELKNAKVMVNVLQSQGLLPTIKVFCDWLLCNKKIIQSISKVSTTMWSKLAIFLNCCPLEKYIAHSEICENDYIRNLIRQSNQTKSWNSQPLPEDIHLRSFVAFKLEHMSLKFDINKLNSLSIRDEHLLRLCYLRRFGYLIASLSRAQTVSSNSCSFFEYNASKCAFEAPEITTFDCPKSEEINKTEVKTQLSKEARENRKLQLMKQMAQLRLEAEISQLESTYKNDETHWPPYLVPETSALCNNLKIIQDLSKTNKFIIIIPIVVIDNLDSIKKESKLAREAIRWLENQFKLGNRFLRAQKHDEKISNHHDANLKKKDFDKWMFYQLIDCCKYFEQESSKNSSKDSKLKMVSLLLNNDENKLNDPKIKNFLTKAEENEIDVQDIKEFNDKWVQNKKA